MTASLQTRMTTNVLCAPLLPRLVVVFFLLCFPPCCRLPHVKGGARAFQRGGVEDCANVKGGKGREQRVRVVGWRNETVK